MVALAVETKKKLTPLRAIRAKCMDCSCGSSHEVRECTIDNCPLFQYRMGHNPKRKGVGGNPSLKVKKPNSQHDPETRTDALV